MLIDSDGVQTDLYVIAETGVVKTKCREREVSRQRCEADTSRDLSPDNSAKNR
jgi:hypothetical protein